LGGVNRRDSDHIIAVDTVSRGDSISVTMMWISKSITGLGLLFLVHA